MSKIRFISFTLLLSVLSCAGLHAQQSAAVAPARAAKRPSDYLNEQMPKWVRLNGEVRGRIEGLTGIGYGTSNDAYWLHRVRLNMTLLPTAWMKLQLQAQDAQVFGRNAKPDGPPFADTMDLRAAYLEVGDPEKQTFALRAGRQELVFGAQRLVGHVSWLNTARTFDAVRATMRAKLGAASYRLDAFAASVVNIRDADFNKRAAGNNFHGAYGSITSLVPLATIEPYGFWRLSPRLTAETGTRGNLDAKTIGVRWVGKLPAGVDYGMEMARQVGSLASDDVDAWAGHWVAGVVAPMIAYSPRVFVEYNFASGDADPRDGSRGTFDQLYPTAHDKYGLADQVGWRNIHHGRAGIEMKPQAKLLVTVGYQTYWLDSARDGLYAATGALVARRADGSAGRRVGTEMDLQAVYTLSPQIQISGGFGRLFPGAFLRATTPGGDYQFSYLMWNYTF